MSTLPPEEQAIPTGLDVMLMTIISLAHEAVTDDAIWAAVVARYPGLAGQQEVLHGMADMTWAVYVAAMQEEAAEAALSAWPATSRPAAGKTS